MNVMILTEEQREYAELQHDIIKVYLRANRLSESEFYDVVIFGFLRAVRKYFDRPELRIYPFRSIAWRAMDTEVGNYRRAQNRQMRKAAVYSLDEGVRGCESLTLADVISVPDQRMEELETSLLWCEIASAVSSQQLKILKLKMQGYDRREIARKCRLRHDALDELFEQIKSIARCMGIREDGFYA